MATSIMQTSWLNTAARATVVTSLGLFECSVQEVPNQESPNLTTFSWTGVIKARGSSIFHVESQPGFPSAVKAKEWCLERIQSLALEHS